MSTRTLLAAASLLMMMSTGSALAADPCTQFKWDVTHEHRLFSGAPSATLAAGATAGEAPRVSINTLYALTLKPHDSVQLATLPSKKMFEDGTFAGMVALTVPVAGAYRISLDAGFWLDISRNGQPLESVDFNGAQACTAPRKIVVYNLPANVPLVLQFNGAGSAEARLTVTPVVASPQ